MDEPETALSPPAQLGLAARLLEWAESGHRQAVVATRSPFFMRIPRAELIEIGPAGPRVITRRESNAWALDARAATVSDAAWEAWLRGVLVE